MVGGEFYRPRKTVSRDGKRWRVQVQRKGQPITRRSFTDSLHGGPAGALDAAHAWLDAQSIRAPYDCVAPRADGARRLTVTRRLRDSAGGVRIPRFTLEITPSKSAWRRDWMRVYLGTVMTINQHAIDVAVDLLRSRWDAFNQHAALHGRAAALSQDYASYALLPPPPHGTALRLVDLLAWNGDAEEVTYSPRSLVREGADDLFWPELEPRRLTAMGYLHFTRIMGLGDSGPSGMERTRQA